MKVGNKNKLFERPWGWYLLLEKNKNYWLKKIFIKKNELLSLQSHNKRHEIWTVLEGTILAKKGKNDYILKQGDFLKINKKEKHRIKGIKDSYILEVAFGRVEEKDIVRYEDKYGRI